MLSFRIFDYQIHSNTFCQKMYFRVSHTFWEQNHKVSSSKYEHDFG